MSRKVKLHLITLSFLVVGAGMSYGLYFIFDRLNLDWRYGFYLLVGVAAFCAYRATYLFIENMSSVLKIIKLRKDIDRSFSKTISDEVCEECGNPLWSGTCNKCIPY